MESIDAPARGERIAWDVVASAVNPEGGKFKFTTSTLNFAIKELGERGSFDRAHALYLWMSRKQGRYAPNEFTYVSLASAAKTLTQTRTVQNLWQRGIAENDESLICNEIASAVIAALNRVSDWSGAYQVFRDMGDKGKPRNLYTYTAVLTALRDEAKPDEALAVLNEMAREPGVQPTSLAFSLTLTAFDNCRRWIEGNAVAKRIKKYDVRPDATLMHAIITMAGRAGDMAHANEVFDAMRNSTMIVTTYTFNALLGGYARYGDWEGCTEVYDEMKRSKIQPDSYTFHAAHICCRAKRRVHRGGRRLDGDVAQPNHPAHRHVRSVHSLLGMPRSRPRSGGRDGENAQLLGRSTERCGVQRSHRGARAKRRSHARTQRARRHATHRWTYAHRNHIRRAYSRMPGKCATQTRGRFRRHARLARERWTTHSRFVWRFNLDGESITIVVSQSLIL